MQRSARANSAPSRAVRMCGSVEAAPSHRQDGVPRSTVAGTTARVASTVLSQPDTVSDPRVALQWLQLWIWSHCCRDSVPLAAVMVWCRFHDVGFLFLNSWDSSSVRSPKAAHRSSSQNLKRSLARKATPSFPISSHRFSRADDVAVGGVVPCGPRVRAGVRPTSLKFTG